jgi:hypothetical protein
MSAPIALPDKQRRSKGGKHVERYMTKTANASKTPAKNGKDFPDRGPGYREIGIAAVAAALHCQHMHAQHDDHAAEAPDSAHADRRP